MLATKLKGNLCAALQRGSQWENGSALAAAPAESEKLPVTDLSAIRKQQGQRAEEGMAL